VGARRPGCRAGVRDGDTGPAAVLHDVDADGAAGGCRSKRGGRLGRGQHQGTEIGALAANSPFWEDRDTGLCSVRPKLNEAFPRTGVRPSFPSWDAYPDLLRWSRAGGR
jgi:hypothetical protein